MKNEILKENRNVILNQLNNIVTNENMKKIMISKEDFKKYLKSKKIITLNEYNKYLKTKSGKSREIKKHCKDMFDISLQ